MDFCETETSGKRDTFEKTEKRKGNMRKIKRSDT